MEFVNTTKAHFLDFEDRVYFLRKIFWPRMNPNPSSLKLILLLPIYNDWACVSPLLGRVDQTSLVEPLLALAGCLPSRPELPTVCLVMFGMASVLKLIEQTLFSLREIRLGGTG